MEISLLASGYFIALFIKIPGTFNRYFILSSRIFHCTFHMDTWGLYLAQVNPYGIHGITVGWGLSQFIVPWTSWIPCGMIMEWLIPYGIQLYSTWIPLDSIWNLGISTLDSIWIPLKFHMENTMIFVVKNSVKYENWTLNSTTHHVREWENTLTPAPSNH